MSAVLEVSGLVKHYGDIKAVDGVSFSVQRGEVFALLGPNGAGKSTTVEILEGHRRRDRGQVSVLGVDPAVGGRRFRDRIGIVLQSAGVDEQLTVAEVVDLYATAYTRRRPVAEVLAAVELSEAADARIVTLSGGQRRRVDLAVGLVGDPELLFLDEPTTGFDPAARRRSWELVRSLAAGGRTVVLTTHYLDEAEQLADHVAVLAGGRIVAEGTPASLRQEAAADTVVRFGLPSADEPLAGLFEPLAGEVTGQNGRITIATPSPTADLAHITGWAAQRGIELEGLAVESISFEDVYLQLIGEVPESGNVGSGLGAAVVPSGSASDAATDMAARDAATHASAFEAVDESGEDRHGE